MKREIIFRALLAMLILVGFASCKDDDNVQLASVNVQVTASETFQGIAVKGLMVKLVNTADNATTTATTDAKGLASFTDIAPGTYNIATSVDLTAEKAGEISGYYEALTLNATASNVNLLAGVVGAKTIILDGSPSSSLVIKEFYFDGANDPTYSTLFKDQFIEIYNNSSKTIYADGLYIAGLAPQANGSDAKDTPTSLSLKEYVYATKIMQVPGNGADYPIAAGESIVIALNAVDYSDGGAKSYGINLSGADLETYAIDWFESLGRKGNAYFDLDNVDVPNMTCIYNFIENYGVFNFDMQSASVIIFRADNFDAEANRIANPDKTKPSYSDYWVKIPVANIIDGIDMMYSADTGNFKRLPTSVDAGFNTLGGNPAAYSGKSARRKVAKEVNGRKILMDTNNSTNDIEIIDKATPKSFD